MSLAPAEPHNSTRSPIPCKCRKDQPHRTFFCAVDKAYRPVGNASVSKNSWLSEIQSVARGGGDELGVEIAVIVGSCGRQHYLSSRNTRQG